MHVSRFNTDDIIKYFKGTYVKFKEEDDKIFYVKHVTPTSIIVSDSKNEEAMIDLSIDGGYTIDYVIPKKTAFQVGENAMFLSRVPARMWRKGMDNKNTQFHILNNASTWSPVTFDIHTIEAFVNKPCYFTFTDALRHFTEGVALNSAALTPRISISRNGCVFIDTVLVGKYSFAKKELSCKAIFKEELSSVFSCKVRTVS